MRHIEWSAEIRAALELQKEGRHDEAVRAFKRVLRKVRAGQKERVHAWHESQTLGMIAMTYESHGDLKAALTYELRSAECDKQSAQSHSMSAAYSLALAAIWSFELKKTPQAVALGKEALQLFGQHIDPSPIFEELISNLREYYEHRARRHGSRPGKKR
jgi:tetratricopeptide (TPR) repeat protein